MLPLKGLTGICTGGKKRGGIAQATIRDLASAGANITIIDLDDDVVEFAKDLNDCRCMNEEYGVVQAFVGDLRDPDVAMRVAEMHWAAWGALSFVVNVAGGSDPSVPLNTRHTRPNHVDMLIQKNVHTALNLTNAALPYLLQTTASRTVINFGTVNGLPGWGWAREPALAGAKACLRAMTVAAAAELRGSIDFVFISPGSVPNPHGEVWSPRLEDSRCIDELRHIYPRFITAEQIAAVVRFVLDPRSPSFTGHDFVVDAGVSVTGLREVRADGKWFLPVGVTDQCSVKRRKIADRVSEVTFGPLQNVKHHKSVGTANAGRPLQDLLPTNRGRGNSQHEMKRC